MVEKSAGLLRGSSGLGTGVPLRRRAPLEPRQPVADLVPGDPVFQPHVARGRELVRMVQGCGGHVDKVRVSVVSVGERRAAPAAEGPPNLGRRAVLHRVAGEPGEARGREGEPGDGLGAGGPAARHAVADQARLGFPGHAVPHLTAKASAVAHLSSFPHRPVCDCAVYGLPRTSPLSETHIREIIPKRDYSGKPPILSGPRRGWTVR
jgi:hypothetical protein